MPKKKFIVTAEVTISVHTEVVATSAEKAIEIANGRGMVSLCYQCGGTDTARKEFVTSGALDGEPTNLRAEELE